MNLEGAACFDKQEVMFSPNPVKALALCAACPVLTECEAQARKDHEMWTTLPGVIAGKTSVQRGVHVKRHEVARGDIVSAVCDHCGDVFEYPLQTRRRKYCTARCSARHYEQTRSRSRAKARV